MPIKRIETPKPVEETAVISLRSTFGYGNPKVYYGPGEAVTVPIGLARSLGKIEETAVSSPTQINATMELIPGVNETLAGALVAAGFVSIEDVAEASVQALTAVSGIGKKTAEKLKKAAQELL